MQQNKKKKNSTKTESDSEFRALINGYKKLIKENEKRNTLLENKLKKLNY